MTTALITHFDLDACSAQIIAKHVFDVSESKCQGYGKVRVNLEKLVDAGHDTLIVTDLSMEKDDLVYATEKFGRVVFFDHHESSEEYVALANTIDNLEVVFSIDMCAAMHVFKYGVTNGSIDINTQLGKDLMKLAMYTDVFDLWKTEHASWSIGYSLNTLFWELNFWNFEKRFADGFTPLTDEENALCFSLKQMRLSTIESAPMIELAPTPLSPKGVVIAFEDSTAVSDVSLELDYDLYMIAYYNKGELKMSVRAKDTNFKNINVNEVLKTIAAKHDKIVQAAGGHRLAGGITLCVEIDVMKAVEFFRHVVYREFELALMKDDEIPF